MHSLLARGLALGAMLLSAVVLPGCGGGHHRHHDDFGTIEIINDDIEDVIVDLQVQDLFSSYDETFVGIDLFPGDSIELDLFPSSYEFTMYWDDLAITSFVEDIFDGDDFAVYVTN